MKKKGVNHRGKGIAFSVHLRVRFFLESRSSCTKYWTMFNFVYTAFKWLTFPPENMWAHFGLLWDVSNVITMGLNCRKDRNDWDVWWERLACPSCRKWGNNGWNIGRFCFHVCLFYSGKIILFLLNNCWAWYKRITTEKGGAVWWKW